MARKANNANYAKQTPENAVPPPVLPLPAPAAERLPWNQKQ